VVAAPVQIPIAKEVFSPERAEVESARKVIEAIPDGGGVHMIDGKLRDDGTWKQCRVIVDLAETLAAKDPELAEVYGMSPALRRPRDRPAGGRVLSSWVPRLGRAARPG
jgi:malyl-CoA/(S)-citramalyl-CoA lyase